MFGSGSSTEGKKVNGKGKGGDGKGKDELYQSEEREAVEVKERLRFPYPAYSTVDFVKK